MTIKLCNCIFLETYQELIVLDICDEVNILEEYNQTAFHSLELLITFSYLPMLPGIFRSYALLIPFFEVRVLPWQSLLKQGHEEGAGDTFQS